MLFEKTKINEKEAGEKTECKWVASAKGVSFQVQVFKGGNNDARSRCRQEILPSMK